MFLDDIVDDDVLPNLNLSVDGLNTASDAKEGGLELRPEDVAANDAPPVDSSIPEMRLGAEQLDVYGWESSLWRKIKGYLGF